LSLSVVSAQEGGGESQPPQEPKTATAPSEARTPMEQALARLASKQLHLKEPMGEIPTTLAEAHAELERILTDESLAMIDAMDSEDGTSLSHHGLGASMRRAWGLWGDSVLAQHMKELGFTNGDDMSGTILDTLWCKRHGQDFRLEERAAKYREYWEREQNRVPKARTALRRRMMGLHFEQREVPKVPIAVGNERGLRARFLCLFRDGVFLTAYHRGSRGRMSILMQESYTDPNGDGRPTSEYDDFVHRGYCFDRTADQARKLRKMKPGEAFYTQGYYFDPADGQIHKIDVPEVNEVYGAVVAGERAWFGGLTNGEFVVVGVGAQDRITVPLPQDDEMPDLGADGQFLMAVYTKAIYRLEDRTWMLVHSGDMLLPRSGLPPLRYGNTVFFRDEENAGGRYEGRLWWLTMAEPLHLSVLDRHLEVITAGVLDLREVTSCCLTSGGDLWVCTGEHPLGNCLLRRSMDGSYSVATVGGSVRLAEDWPDSRPEYEGAAVSAVRALPDETLLLAGRTGLYRLKGDELVQELAFTLDRPSKWVKERDRVVPHVTWHRQDGKMVKEVTDVVQKASGPGRQVFSSVPWIPNNVLQLDDGSYLLGTDRWEGAYWLRPDDEGQWTCLPADEGDPVEW
jgi:Domain of unknown function (DUF6794)